MEALYLLIPLSVVAVFAAAWIFLRMSESGQFEDMDGPAWSVLHDDDRPASGPAKDDESDDGATVDGGEKRDATVSRSGNNTNMTDNGGSVRIDAAQDRQRNAS